MATQYARLTAVGGDLDALASALELEANITSAAVEGHNASDGLTNPGTTRSDGVVQILITGTTDAAITAAIAAVGSLAKVTNALASSDAEA